MELNDVFRRTVGQHWRLLTVCLLVGMAVGFSFVPHGKEYAATTRLVLDTPDPVGRQQSQAYADTVKAIATSRSQVAAALRTVGARRGDPAAYGAKHVNVVGLGTSGIVQLTVTDRSAPVAAAVANALSARVIRTRLTVTDGQLPHVFGDLDRRIARLTAKIGGASNYLNALGLRLASAKSPAAARRIRAHRSAMQAGIDLLVQQRTVLQSQRLSLLATTAQRPRPAVISAAVPPSTPTASHGLSYLMLGALLGLAAGLGAAGLIETVRPTLVGGDTLADELDAALLGTLEPTVGAATAADIGARLRLAAATAQVGSVSLVSAGPGVDLDRVAVSLGANGRKPAGGAHKSPGLRIVPFAAETPPVNNGVRNGLVLVTPSALKKAELNDIAHLLKVSRLPLLGVITYAPPQGRLQRHVTTQIRILKELGTR